MPYRRNVELSVLAAQFVDDHRQNLVFRFYIPQGRLWAEQAGDLLDLFRDYLAKAIGLHVRASSHSSPAGTTYEFYVDGETTPDAMESRLPGFTRAMDLCVRDPDRAETLLIEQGADAAEASRLVTHYRRRMKRIATDTRHERENKVLALRHQLENDLESVAEDASPEVIALLVDQLTPVAEHAPGLLLGLVDTSRSTAAANVVVNYRPQIFSHVQGIVAQEVSGTQNFGTDAMQILELIRAAGGGRSAELTSALHELEGGAATDAGRLKAAGRLRTFLAIAASKIADKSLDAAIAAGQTYLQQRFDL